VTVEVWADWQAEHRLLKYELVTDYRSSHARFGMPFGSVRRRIEPGSRQADAMWEVPGQRWAALTNDHESEGVGIAMEATYGFSALPGQLSVSLLRASTSPDPHNDRGGHRVRFALAPYAAYSVDDTPSTALLPEIAFGSYALTPRHVSASGGFTFARLGTLVPSAIKPAEDGSAVVVRAHDTLDVSLEETCMLGLGTQMSKPDGQCIAVSEGLHLACLCYPMKQ
jgi:alpha-mannosidase